MDRAEGFGLGGTRSGGGVYIGKYFLSVATCKDRKRGRLYTVYIVWSFDCPDNIVSLISNTSSKCFNPLKSYSILLITDYGRNEFRFGTPLVARIFLCDSEILTTRAFDSLSYRILVQPSLLFARNLGHIYWHLKL